MILSTEQEREITRSNWKTQGDWKVNRFERSMRDRINKLHNCLRNNSYKLSVLDSKLIGLAQSMAIVITIVFCFSFFISQHNSWIVDGCKTGFAFSRAGCIWKSVFQIEPNFLLILNLSFYFVFFNVISLDERRTGKIQPT